MCLLIRTVSHVSDVARGPLLFFFPVSFHFLCMHHLNKPKKIVQFYHYLDLDVTHSW